MGGKMMGCLRCACLLLLASASAGAEAAAAASCSASAMRDQAFELHKAGEYSAAADVFDRALLAAVDEGQDDAFVRKLRLSHAASLLKVGDWTQAEAACTPLLKSSGSGSSHIRQKAYFRRAKARKGLGETAKAYRDGYIAMRMSPADEKAKVLLNELRMELQDEEISRVEEQAERHLASTKQPLSPDLSSALSSFGAPGLGSLGPMGGTGDFLGSMMAMAGPGGVGGGMGSSLPLLFSQLRTQLRKPSIQKLLCGFLHKADAATLRKLAAQGTLPISDEGCEKLGTFLTSLQPANIAVWVDRGELGVALYKKAQQLRRAICRLLPLLGIYIMWIWLKSYLASR